MSNKEIRDLTNEEITKKIEEYKEELFNSLKALKKGVQNNKKRVDDILYYLINGNSLLGRLFSLNDDNNKL